MFHYTSLTVPLQGDVAWSKKPTKRRRRSIAKDRKIIAITRLSTPLTPTVSDGALVTDPTPPITHPTPANDDSKPIEKPAQFHSWDHTTDIAKVVFANRASYQEGRAYAFSLNLSPKEIAAANDNAKGFTEYFTSRITRNLRRIARVDAPYWFGVDVTKTERLHLHGGIEANDNNAAAIERALELAGGVWESKRGREYQCKMTPMYTPDIWANYCLRAQAKVKRLIVGKAISITTSLRRRAKTLYSGRRH